MNSDLLYKIKKYTKKIISIYSYLVIIISLLLLIGGGKINVSDDDPSFIIVGLLFFFIFIIAVFIVVPVFFYYLYKRNFKIIKNLDHGENDLKTADKVSTPKETNSKKKYLYPYTSNVVETK